MQEKKIHTKNAKERRSIKALEGNTWWLDFNYYITNVPEVKLSKEKV